MTLHSILCFTISCIVLFFLTISTPLNAGECQTSEPRLEDLAEKVKLHAGDASAVRFSQVAVRKFAATLNDDTDLESEGLPIVDVTANESAFFANRYRVYRRTLSRIPQTLSKPSLLVEHFESYPEWDTRKDLLLQSERYYDGQDIPEFSATFFTTRDIVADKDPNFHSRVCLVNSRFEVPEDLALVFDGNHINKLLTSFGLESNVTIQSDHFADRPCLRIVVSEEKHSCEFCICPNAGYAVLYLKRTYGDRPGYYREFIVKEMSEDGTHLVTCKNDVYDAAGKKVGSTTRSVFSEIAFGADKVALDATLELSNKLTDGLKVYVEGEDQINYHWKNGRVEKVIDHEILERLKKRDR